MIELDLVIGVKSPKWQQKAAEPLVNNSLILWNNIMEPVMLSTIVETEQNILFTTELHCSQLN